ncbi:hypothetical protein J4Q44_G00371020, partial [Coregonus suidteri]
HKGKSLPQPYFRFLGLFQVFKFFQSSDLHLLPEPVLLDLYPLAMEFLKSYKKDLCKWLSMKDAKYIIDKCENILTAKQDKAIGKQKTDAGKISLLLETLIEMEDSKCEEFLKILKEEQTHYPGLQQHFNKRTQASSSPTVCMRNATALLIPGKSPMSEV